MSNTLIKKNSLRIGLLQQRAPELVVRFRVHEDQLVVVGGQHVVYDHLLPAAVLPEPVEE